MNKTPELTLKQTLELLGYEFVQKPQFVLVKAPDESRVAIKDDKEETIIKLLNDRANLEEIDFCNNYVL